ncbi:MAG: nucleotidyl transferase AbiEii/AbiGii toxin family protein [Alphaproteobacteria bacterium]|jgi:predicted nucleotidyltransferase component of viral defense system
MAVSLDEVRRRILIALFSDDELMDVLVLKGGNALSIIHKVGSRASLDMDFSIKRAFADLTMRETGFLPLSIGNSSQLDTWYSIRN